VKRCISIDGADGQARLACATAIGQALESGGCRVAYVANWNRSGDPDPYQSSPFSELALVSPEAGLVYRRSPVGAESAIDSAMAGWVILDGIDDERAVRVACSPDRVTGRVAAVWGFDSPPLPRLDAVDLDRCAVESSLAREATAPCERTGAGSGCRASCTAQGQAGEHVRVTIGGREIPLSEFPRQVIESTIKGLLSSIKGYDDCQVVEVFIPAGKA
jgi:hypothetical protein